jgi:hypothetical protein
VAARETVRASAAVRHGPSLLRIVHGDERRRLTLPLIYWTPILG